MESVSIQPSDFILRSYRDGSILSKQNMVPMAQDCFGVPYLHIHRADYHKILVDEANRLGVTILLRSNVTNVDFEKPSIQLMDKTELHADVVLGADGLKSVCREVLLGRPDPPCFTGDLAYRIIIKAEDMKKHPNLRELVEQPAMNYWMGPHSHVVSYLLKGGGLYNIVLICPDDLPSLENTAKADPEEMRDIFKHWDPKLKELLGLVQETTKWRLQNSREMQSWRHPHGNFALLGDACHATLPYLYVFPLMLHVRNRDQSLIVHTRAQGAAQAVEDGAVLGALFERIERRSQIADVLLIYERLRKGRTTRIVRGSTATGHIFHLEDGEQQQERDRQLTEQEPCENYPNRWADPVFRNWLFGYDADREVEIAWGRYKDDMFKRSTSNLRSAL